MDKTLRKGDRVSGFVSKKWLNLQNATGEP
jgi:hypothetical protein